jgi:hypothetical protein
MHIEKKSSKRHLGACAIYFSNSEPRARALLRTRIGKRQDLKMVPEPPISIAVQSVHQVVQGAETRGEAPSSLARSDCAPHRAAKRMGTAATRCHRASFAAGIRPCEAAGGGGPASPRKGAQTNPYITAGSAGPPRTRPPHRREPRRWPFLPAPRRVRAGLRRALGAQPRLAAVLGITHYLPQANVARDGQSERQSNVLHGLSHGSVQNPANTEVPPTAAPRRGWERARPATAARRGHEARGADGRKRAGGCALAAQGPDLIQDTKAFLGSGVLGRGRMVVYQPSGTLKI